MNIINFSHSAVNPIINYSITDSSSLANLVPKEIWQKIASFLNDCKDVIHLGLSNRHLCVALLFDVPLWEIFCQRDFPDSSTHPQSNLPAPALYKQLAIVANHMKTPGHYRLKTLTAHDGKVQNIEHYKGMLVSSGSGDETIKIWDLKTGKVIQTLETGQPVEHISIYDRTKLISVGEDDMIQIFDLETKKLQQILNTNQPNIISIAVYDDLLFCSSFDGTIKIVNLKTVPEKMQEEIQTLNTNLWSYSITAVAGKLFIGTSKGPIKVYDLKTKEELTLRGHKERINCMAVWGNQFISCSSDSTIKIWDFNTGELLQTLNGHEDRVEKIVVYDDMLISCSEDRTIKIWDLNTRKILQTLQHKEAPSCITFYEGQIIAGSWNSTIKIWDFNF